MTRGELLRAVQERRKLRTTLKLISHVTVLFSVALYVLLIYKAFSLQTVMGFKALAVSATAFFVVSLVRMLIDAPRPYEVYDCFDIPPKNKKGRSFPGRHAFSVFCVATLAFPLFPILSVVVAFFGVLLSVSRVLLGIHFVRDVVCGAALGIISGVVGIFAAGNPF